MNKIRKLEIVIIDMPLESWRLMLLKIEAEVKAVVEKVRLWTEGNAQSS